MQSTNRDLKYFGLLENAHSESFQQVKKTRLWQHIYFIMETRPCDNVLKSCKYYTVIQKTLNISFYVLE